METTRMPLDATNKHDSPDGDDPFSNYNSPESAILFPVGERAIGWKTKAGGYEQIKSHKAIIRMTPAGDAALVLSVVGSGYRLVHNRELFGRVEDTMRKQMQDSDLHDVRVTDRVSGWGRTCYREYVFPNIKCYVGGQSKSSVAFRLIVQNGYGGSALRIHAGAIEFWCSNGMISGDFTSTYRRHTSRLEVVGMERAVTNALETFAVSQVRWRKWAHTEVKHAEAMQLFRDIAASPKLLESLTDQYTREVDERGANLWAVYSALTYYSSHNEGQFSLRKSVEAQDTVASIMLQRELNVAQWIKSDTWRKLEEAI
jgi:hypothetical protein